jgi:hypothetical protein
MRVFLTVAAVSLAIVFAASGAPPAVGVAGTTPTPEYSVYLPLVAVPLPTPTPGPEWDPRLTFLNIQLTPATGSPFWRVTKGLFQDWNEGGGNHSIFVDVLGEDGQRLALSQGTVIGTIGWGLGSSNLVWGGTPAPEYPVNYPMFGGLGSYTVTLTLDGLSSDQVAGMGLVDATPGGVLLPSPGHVHCNYLFTFRRTTR